MADITLGMTPKAVKLDMSRLIQVYVRSPYQNSYVRLGPLHSPPVVRSGFNHREGVLDTEEQDVFLDTELDTTLEPYVLVTYMSRLEDYETPAELIFPMKLEEQDVQH